MSKKIYERYILIVRSNKFLYVFRLLKLLFLEGVLGSTLYNDAGLLAFLTGIRTHNVMEKFAALLKAIDVYCMFCEEQFDKEAIDRHSFRSKEENKDINELSNYLFGAFGINTNKPNLYRLINNWLEERPTLSLLYIALDTNNKINLAKITGKPPGVARNAIQKWNRLLRKPDQKFEAIFAPIIGEKLLYAKSQDDMAENKAKEQEEQYGYAHEVTLPNVYDLPDIVEKTKEV